ncbi:hypothetical protein H257_10438 [Aphanomyces astaci]|uniref:EGF-like domain-containing protein n=1 Tax=Aphanomyces astaci TaxID=112090 RepID=W4G7I8_APHAT|nr:hypothetical protein H257_10438 [Aphanomyces astaci]ETV75246.1 hypothetical protein H257_10438 [Aphanomyces astaci]|eukprot:XP_009835294.1 hypothetical protein H257_10438 [Aphanomyces astaci]
MPMMLRLASLRRHQQLTPFLMLLVLLVVTSTTALDHEFDMFPPKSGVGIWVDVDTPLDLRTKVSSRGERWDLVMSDEFEIDGRSFHAGKDHLWTALDIPDGVNAALELYNSSNVYTKNGKLVNKVEEGTTMVTYFNQWLEKPAFETNTLHYSAGMMQSWNKFCMQGGLIEVSAKLPGAINNVPDAEHKSVTNNPNAVGVFWKDGVKSPLTARDRIKDGAYYPTWPGIWLMGNLGRALFTASTTRMWPWTYNECDADLAPHQVISACNATPGFGLNPNQGRGAPEIDILEGGGAAISSSIQIAPGMPDNYRRIPMINPDNKYCVYGKACATPGANIPDAPTSTYASRGHRSWYQGLKYAANNRCPPTPMDIQAFEPVRKRVELLVSNVFDKSQMSAARDVNADLGLIDGKGPGHWGINSNGTCFPIANGYIGAFLCDPDSKNLKCEAPRREGVADTNQMAKFEYQMDAISANWDIGHEAYTTFYKYQVEWVMGPNGYVRWSLMDAPLFEIPASAVTSPPQSTTGTPRTNPKKLMIEEPLYIIFNVALAKAWGATPPNADIGPCRGNGTHPSPGSEAANKSNNICDSFPMYMEIEYIRVYQDKSSMFVGCDPPSHPTKKWIDGHIKWYTDAKNPLIRVDGGATCTNDDDCVSVTSSTPNGRCNKRRCECVVGYGGPRCTKYVGSKTLDTSSPNYFGPQFLYPVILAAVVAATVALTCVLRKRRIVVAATVSSVRANEAKGEEGTSDNPHDSVAMLEFLANPQQNQQHRRFYAPANTADA